MDLSDACVYLLGRAIVIRREQTDLREPGVSYNTIKYNPVGKADFVNPNLDLAYLEAWVAVHLLVGHAGEVQAELLELIDLAGRQR